MFWPFMPGCTIPVAWGCYGQSHSDDSHCSMLFMCSCSGCPQCHIHHTIYTNT